MAVGVMNTEHTPIHHHIDTHSLYLIPDDYHRGLCGLKMFCVLVLSQSVDTGDTLKIQGHFVKNEFGRGIQREQRRGSNACLVMEYGQSG